MSKGPSPELFFDTVNAYQQSAALKAAIELGLFTAIGGGKVTAGEIARTCRVAERGARILSDYLVTLGFLVKEGERYGLTADSAMFLDQKSPAYVGAAVEFLDSAHLRDSFDALPDRVRAGGAPLTRDSVLAPEHEAWVKFARGMASLQMMPARLLAGQVLGADGEKAGPMRVLDLAAGHGMFGIAFLQQNPQARVVGQDWANVLEVAKENAARMGVLDRYELLPGNAFETQLGTGYDVVLVPNLLHHFDEQANVILMKRVHAALKPGGRAVVLEFVPDEGRVTPAIAARFSVVMLATTPAGDAYTEKELRRIFAGAGFGGEVVVGDLAPTPSRVVIGRK
jgi:SAM-dependent methyltransferase